VYKNIIALLNHIEMVVVSNMFYEYG